MNNIPHAQLVFATSGDILNNGVLCQNPFGRHMELELINLSSDTPLLTELSLPPFSPQSTAV
eukprot:SAG22_NODE_104_length_20159_cov_5.877517_7_plen_62_part_00